MRVSLVSLKDLSGEPVTIKLDKVDASHFNKSLSYKVRTRSS